MWLVFWLLVLLARVTWTSHLELLRTIRFELIDLVVVNLYPFKETILKPDVTYADAVENIDIGGPSCFCSENTLKCSRVEPYAVVLDELASNGEETSYETRQRLAASIPHSSLWCFDHISASRSVGEKYELTLTYDLKQPPRWKSSNKTQTSTQRFFTTAYSVLPANSLTVNCLQQYSFYPYHPLMGSRYRNWDYGVWLILVAICVVLNREVDEATAQKMHGVFAKSSLPAVLTEREILTKKKKHVLRSGAREETGKDSLC